MATTNRDILFTIRMRNAARADFRAISQTFRSLGGQTNLATRSLQAYTRAMNAAGAAAQRLNQTLARQRLPSVPSIPAGGVGGSHALGGLLGGGLGSSSINGVLAGAAAGVASVVGLRQLKEQVEAYQNLQGVLTLVQDSQQQVNAVFGELRNVANRTRQSLEPTVDLYGRMARASRNMEVTSYELVEATEAVNNAILLSRASTQAATASLIQLGQALGSDRLGGDELRSIAEQTPILAQAIIDGMDAALLGGQARTIATLKKLGSEGKLTAEVVFKAIQSQQKQLAEQVAKVPLTIGQSMNVLRNNLIDAFGRLDQELGISSKISKAIIWLANNLEEVGKVIKVVLITALAVAIPAAARIAIGALGSLFTLVGRHPFVALAAAITAVVAALDELGEAVVTNAKTGETLGDALKVIQDGARDSMLAMRDWLQEITGGDKIKGGMRSWEETWDIMAGQAREAMELTYAGAKTLWTSLKHLFGGQSADVGTGISFVDLFNKYRGQFNSAAAQNAQDRIEGAKEAARFQREQDRLLKQSLGSTRPNSGGGSTTDADEAKKFADTFQSLQDRLSPVLARMREYREAVAAINEAETRGLINSAQRDYLLDQANLKLGANNSALGVANKALEENARLIGLTAQEKEIEAAAQALINAAIDESNPLTQRQIDLYKERVRAQQQAQAVADFQRQIDQQVRGIQQETELLGLSNRERERRAVLQVLNNQLDDAGIFNLEKRIELITQVTDALYTQQQAQDALNTSAEYGFSEAFDKFADDAKNVAVAVEDAWTRALNGTADAITDLITTGKADFKSLIDSLLRDLIRLQVVKFLGQALNFLGFGTVAGVAHSGGIAGAVRTTRSVPASVFADAKRYHTGGLAGKEVPIIAERGEAIMPTVRMSDGNLGIRASGVGGSTVFAPTINVAVNGGGGSGNDPAAQQKMGNELARVVEEQMRSLMDEWAANNMRPNGIFNRGMSVA